MNIESLPTAPRAKERPCEQRVEDNREPAKIIPFPLRKVGIGRKISPDMFDDPQGEIGDFLIYTD